MKQKKGQAWGFDLMIALVLFSVGIILFYIFSLNYSGDSESIYNSLIYDGSSLAETLLSEGYPANWNTDSVTKIGLTNENKINDTKLAMFYNLSIKEYNKTRALFNTRYNYYINMSNQIFIENSPVEFIGMKPGNPENLIKITRFTIYQNKPTSLNIYIWE